MCWGPASVKMLLHHAQGRCGSYLHGVLADRVPSYCKMMHEARKGDRYLIGMARRGRGLRSNP